MMKGMSTTSSKRRWSDLTTPQRAAILTAGLAQFTLQAIALRDLRRRPAKHVHGPKRVWAAASFVNFVGPIAYLAWGRRR